MTKTKTGSLRRSIFFVVVQALVIFLLMEGILSVLYYQKYGNDSLATVQLYKKIKTRFSGHDNTYDISNQKAVRPDSPDLMNSKFTRETKESNIMVYEPWMQFKNIDFSGTYINVQGAVRTSLPDAFYTGSADTVTIYFFGGSTQFGFNVTDAETIPAQFMQLYRHKYPHGKSVKIVNYGMPFYFSYQELLLMSGLFFNGHKPGMVIFLDGLNDFQFVKASYYHQPFFSYALRQVFDKEYLATNKFHFKDTSSLMVEDPKGVSRQEVCHTLVSYYFENIRNMQQIADAYHAKAYFFCQPVPFYHYPLQDSDPYCDKDKNTRFDLAYPLVEKQGMATKNFFFLGDMLLHESGYPFVDGFHYSPGLSKKIADRILDAVKTDLQ